MNGFESYREIAQKNMNEEALGECGAHDRFEAVDVFGIDENAAALIGREQMLITAARDGGANTMTASWGALGVMWGEPVFICAVRPSRHTFSFIEEGDCVTFSFLGCDRKKELALCGSISGRDCDKIARAGLTLKYFDIQAGEGRIIRAPAFDEARLVIVGEKIYFHDIDPNGFMPAHAGKLLSQSYASGDYHRLFICRVIGAFERR